MGFLDNLTKIGGPGIIDTAFQTLIAGATGGFKGRPQWRDLSFMNDAQNRLWPDEIKRQGQFLEGIAGSQGQAMETLAPHQAAAHNTFQDATYGADTARQTTRIKDMASGLNMSPWEITGAGAGGSPVQAMPQQGSNNQGQDRMGTFLQGIIPLKIAQMGNQTQLQTAKIAANTQKYIADQSTAGGKLPLKQIEQIASNINLQDIQHANGIKDLAVKNQNMVVQTLDAILRAMPKDTLSLPGFSSTNTPGWQAVAKALLQDNQQFPGDMGRLNQTLRALPPDAWGAVKDVIIEAGTKAVQTGADAVNAVTNTVGKFLQ